MFRRVHLVGANTKNIFGMEFFVSKAFKELGWGVLETDYRVMDKYEVETRIKYITDVDFLLTIKGERINPESIFSCRVPTVLWGQDSIQANKEMNFVIQTKAPLFNLVYSFNNQELPFYKQYNKNSHFLPLAADVEIHKNMDIPKNIDVGFVGNLNNNRINMINYLLDKGVPIQYSYSQQVYAKIVTQTKINLNIGITDSGYQQRVFEILNMGGFLLTNRVKDENLFIDKEHLIYYNDFNHLYELICYYIDKPDERERIAKAGQKEVLEKHQYIHRVKEIIDKVNSL
mgnify:FL=1